MRKTKRVVIDIPPERWLALRNEAARQKRSMAGLVLQALQGFLQNLPPHLLDPAELDGLDDDKDAA